MNSLPVQPYDILMVAVLVLATFFGAWKGMAWQLASLSSLAVSFVVALRFGSRFAPYISQRDPWNRFVAMLLLYVLTSMAIWLAFRVVAGVIDRVQLREFDRQIGALFGLTKGVLLCLVITFFAVTLSEKARQKVLEARSGYYIARLIQRANPVMPEEVRGVLGKYIDELDRKLDPATPPDPPVQRPGATSQKTSSDSLRSAARSLLLDEVRSMGAGERSVVGVRDSVLARRLGYLGISGIFGGSDRT